MTLQKLQAFVDRCLTNKLPVYLGIDPGATGAIGVLCGRDYAVIDIPQLLLPTRRKKKWSKKNTKAKWLAKNPGKTPPAYVDGHTSRPDNAGICEVFAILRPLKNRMLVILEEAPLSLGPGKRLAEIQLNRAYAIWPLFLYSRAYATREIRPNVWKDALKVPGGDKGKAHARKRASASYPKADLGRVSDHNRAEALLLAEYGRDHVDRTPRDGGAD